MPGGYAESSHLPRLVAEHFPGCRPVGDPLAAFGDAMQGPGVVALLAAPGYVEDQQVVACQADALRARGRRTLVGHPGQVAWHDGRAAMRSTRLDAIVRFFQGEWLTRLPAAAGWRNFFHGGGTPVCNPGVGLLAESKRFPLVWNELKTPLPTWRALLPETREPRWRTEPGWLLKAAFANNGDEVYDRTRRPRDWRGAAWAAQLRPRDWATQRRFEPVLMNTPDGPMSACLGVYTVNGRAAGIYGRLARSPVIDYLAIDVAVLLQ